MPAPLPKGEGALGPGPRAGEVPAPAPEAQPAPTLLAAGIPVFQAGADPGQLVLRARRPCWLVLEIDGQRLPTLTLQDGDKRAWPVSKRAVLLAGNLGALRVWWRGENLAYLGELGQRGNALVFDAGKPYRMDKDAALPLPAGVPE